MKTKVTLITLLISFLFVVAFFVSNQKVVAKFWAVESSKPIKSFEDYSQMNTTSERGTAFNKETPANKSLLWRQNLIFHADRMNLNQEQKAWIKDAYEFMNEDFFAVAGGDESEFIKTAPLGKSYEKLIKRKSELFIRDQAKKFCLIGDDSTLKNSGQESSASSSDDLPAQICNCTWSLCTQCDSPEVCTPNRPCIPVGSGCGCGAVWKCNRICSIDLP